jgi:hypothetical protein
VKPVLAKTNVAWCNRRNVELIPPFLHEVGKTGDDTRTAKKVVYRTYEIDALIADAGTGEPG